MDTLIIAVYIFIVWRAEVEIIKWFVEVGDQIKAFDRVCWDGLFRTLLAQGVDCHLVRADNSDEI